MMQLGAIAMWTHGRLLGADATVDGVAIDTRKLRPGDLFAAFKGERVDGHDYLAQAQAAGASGALVSRKVDNPLPQVLVDDVEAALGDLASAVRAQRHARVIGITGSNGKTTVKTLTASILSLHGRTHVNTGSFNNEIGLPLTLLAMPENAEYAVLEMGAGKPGDIAYLAAIARPDIGLVNLIAPAHLERMGSVEGVAETKGALYQALPADGVAIINADDAFAGFFAGLAGTRRVLRFGLHKADVGADIVEQRADGSLFVLSTPAGDAEVRLDLIAVGPQGRRFRQHVDRPVVVGQPDERVAEQRVDERRLRLGDERGLPRGRGLAIVPAAGVRRAQIERRRQERRL